MALGPLVVGISADANGFAGQAMREIRGATPAIKTQANISGTAIGTALGAGIAMAAMAGINAVRAAISGIVDMVKSGIGLADSLSDSAAKLGITATAMLTFREIASQTGAEIGNIETAVQKMNVKLGEAVMGNATAIQSFAQLGLSATELAAMQPDQAFAAISQAIASIPNHAQQAALAVDVFGRSGASLLPIMGGISEAALTTGERWRELGAEISETDLQSAAGMQDRIDMITATFDRFKILLAAQMVPLLEMALNWIDAMIKSAGGLGPLVKMAVDKFVDLVAFCIDVWQVLKGIFGILKATVEVVIAEGEAFAMIFATLQGAGMVAFGKITQWGANAFADIMKFARQAGDVVANVFIFALRFVAGAIEDVFNFLIDGYNMVADLVGAPLIANVDFRNIFKYQESQAGALESGARSIAEWGKGLADDGMSLIEAAVDSAKEVGDSFNKAFATRDAAVEELMNLGSDSAAFRKSVSEAAAAAAAKGAEAAVMHTGTAQPFQTGMGSSAASRYSAPTGSGISLPSSVSRGVVPAYQMQQPVVVNQQFQTGVTAQDLSRAATKIKQETVNALVTKVSQGGNFRRELQC